MNRLELRLLERIGRGQVGPSIVARAKAIVDQVKRNHARRAAKRAARLQAEAAAQALREQQHAALYARVRARAGDWCELGEHQHPADQLDLHHLEGGSGRRLQQEWDGNLMTACRTCHEAYDLNRRRFIPAILRWCRRHGFPVPRRKEFRTAMVAP